MKNRSVYKHGNGVLVRSSKQHMMNVLLSVHTYVRIPSVGTHAGERSLLMSSCQLPHVINSVDALCCQTHAATSACVSQIEQRKQPVPDVQMRGLVNAQQLMSRGDIHWVRCWLADMYSSYSDTPEIELESARLAPLSSGKGTGSPSL